ncbi:MAG TPA: PTS sugar transporter subunit IIA [Tepidisphaeraceae bacterium]|jgi:fructose-specific phosphotransferase system IIA component
MMRLSEILSPANIRLGLEATTKVEAIRTLVDLLHANGEVSDATKVLESVLDREATRTTGIGNGLAIPHGRSPGTSKLSMAIGRPLHPIDFQSIDGRPVTVIWLLTSPPDQSGAHIKALAAISRLMTSDKFRYAMNHATTPEELVGIVQKQEAGA